MKFLSKNIFHILAIVSIFLGLSEAWKLRWLCDDAFISFSYARNLSEGFGFVYQVGEYVEGYSNFLWTLLLSGFFVIGVSPLKASLVLGILSYFFLLVYLYFVERKERPFSNLPLYLIHFVLFYHGWIFATSGLETMMFTLFLTIGLIEWQKKDNRAGYLLLFAALVRPEGMLFLTLYTFEKGSDTRKIKSAFPFLFFLFFIAARFVYYDDFLPNTYYAKANRPAYFSQGMMYLFYWFRVYPLYTIVFLYSIFLNLDQIYRKFPAFRSLCILIYIFYVLFIGGDFMAMRFWLPVMPYLSWIVYLKLVEKTDELQISSNLKSKWNIYFQRNLILLHLFFILSLAVRLDPFVGENEKEAFWNQVGEERRFYTDSLIQETGYDKVALRDFRVAFFGAQAHFIYFMKPKYAWEAESGLTDKVLAKQESRKPRGRVGHEKYAEPSGLLARDIELVLADRFPEMNLPYITFQFRNYTWNIFVLHYRPEKFSKLCQRSGWDCSLLYTDLLKRKLDIEKEQIFWHD